MKEKNHNLQTPGCVMFYKNYENAQEIKSYFHEGVKPVRVRIFPVVYHSFGTVETGFCQPQIFFLIEKVCNGCRKLCVLCLQENTRKSKCWNCYFLNYQLHSVRLNPLKIELILFKLSQ